MEVRESVDFLLILSVLPLVTVGFKDVLEQPFSICSSKVLSIWNNLEKTSQLGRVLEIKTGWKSENRVLSVFMITSGII